MNNIINNIRGNITKQNGSEVRALSQPNGLTDLWNERQILINEMNEAKKIAIEEVSKKYTDRLAENAREYAMLLQLVGDNSHEPKKTDVPK